MQKRIEEELELIRQRFPDVEYQEEERWVRVSSYSLPGGWNRETTDVAFQISPGHPGAPPYGIYVPAGLRYQERNPTTTTSLLAMIPRSRECGVSSPGHLLTVTGYRQPMSKVEPICSTG